MDGVEHPKESAPEPTKRAFRFDGPELPGVVPTLLGLVCVGVFIGFNTTSGDRTAVFRAWGWGYASEVWRGHVWLLVTSAFLHAEAWHLVFNLYWLWRLGRLAEASLGRVKLLGFVLAAAAFSSAAYMEVHDALGIGLSGVTYALFGYLWVARARVPDIQRGLTPRDIGLFLLWLVGCWAATLWGKVFIANEAHLAGLAFGAAVGATRFSARWKRASEAALCILVAVVALGLAWAPWSATWWGQSNR